MAVSLIVLLGLIPACAGKTHAEEVSRYTDWAHPRVCGENPQPPHPSP